MALFDYINRNTALVNLGSNTSPDIFRVYFSGFTFTVALFRAYADFRVSVALLGEENER